MLSFLIVLTIFVLIITLSYKHFIVSVPEVTGLVTVNLFTGKLKSYPTGLHFKLPWEQVKDGNYINLRIITVPQIEETYPSGNGTMMLVKWSYQYRPLIEHLDKYIAADDSTIKEGLGDVGSSILSSLISAKKDEECKRDKKEIEEKLIERFNEIEPDKLYGIELVKVSLSDMDYEVSVQTVRATEVIATKLKKIAKDLQTGNISEKDALNAAMIINKNISKTVTEVEGQGGEALAALLMAMAKGGKP